MSAVPAKMLLDLWEAGEDPLALLAAADGVTPDASAALPVGRRDAALIATYRRLFGPVIEATARCPACGEVAELVLATDELLQPDGAAPSTAEVEADGWLLHARPATGTDLAALSGARDDHTAQRMLAERIIAVCRRHGRDAPVADVPPAVLARLDRALETIDPLAAITLDLACPGCGAAIRVLHDPAHHLAHAIDAEARRLFGDVARLARAFGWREADILAMPAARRAAYLDLAG